MKPARKESRCSFWTGGKTGQTMKQVCIGQFVSSRPGIHPQLGTSIPSEPRGAHARGWRRERRRGRQQGGGAEAASSTSGDRGGDVRLGSLPDGELLSRETWTLRSGRCTARRSCAMPRSRPWTILPDAPRRPSRARARGGALGELPVRDTRQIAARDRRAPRSGTPATSLRGRGASRRHSRHWECRRWPDAGFPSELLPVFYPNYINTWLAGTVMCLHR
jgi:hypothetical protein